MRQQLRLDELRDRWEVVAIVADLRRPRAVVVELALGRVGVLLRVGLPVALPARRVRHLGLVSSTQPDGKSSRPLRRVLMSYVKISRFRGDLSTSAGANYCIEKKLKIQTTKTPT